MGGNILVYVALFGLIPLIVGLFAFVEPRRAVIYSFLASWLFLPMAHIPLHGFTDYNKMSAACFGVLIASMIFDNETIFSFRPKIWDLPMLFWCVCPCISSVANGLGWYDGIVSTTYQTTAYGLPYFIGRIYFNDLKGLRELAIGIVVGGLLYVPLCWFEIRMSPQLHMLVYGFHQHDFSQTKRYGGWRPMVFMQHGLAVGMWMCTATVCAFAMWRAKYPRKVMGIPMGLAFIILFVTAVACHSLGAAVLMVAGIAVLILTHVTKSPVWIILLALVPAIYVFSRTTGMWSGKSALDFIGQEDTRGESSLKVRFESEDLLMDKAFKSPIFGWAGWDRFRQKDSEGKSVGVPDALWIIALGHYGFIGLISITAAITFPLLLLAYRVPVRNWAHAGAAPAAAIAVLLGMHMIDNLLNAMVNPIYILGAGGISGLAFTMTAPIAPYRAIFTNRGSQKQPARTAPPMTGPAAPAM